MLDAPAGQRVRGRQLDPARPGIIDVEQHGIGHGARLRLGVLGDETEVAGILDVDDAQVPRAGEKVARGLGVGRLGYAVGDLDQRVAEVAGLDMLGGEAVGEILARAAQIEQHIDADGVEHVGDDADDDEADCPSCCRWTWRAEGGEDLIQHLHQHAGHRHDQEVAVDDVAQLVGDDRAFRPR